MSQEVRVNGGAQPVEPFDEDCIVAATAERIGYEVQRSLSIVITDRKAIEAQGLMKRSPDYAEIRRMLNDGVKVEGAEFGPVEYRLQKQEERHGDGSKFSA